MEASQACDGVANSTEALLERLRGRRWVLVTDDPTAVADALFHLPLVPAPAAVLVPPCRHLLARADFGASTRIATHPKELQTGHFDVTIAWSSGQPPTELTGAGPRVDRTMLRRVA